MMNQLNKSDINIKLFFENLEDIIKEDNILDCATRNNYKKFINEYSKADLSLLEENYKKIVLNEYHEDFNELNILGKELNINWKKIKSLLKHSGELEKIHNLSKDEKGNYKCPCCNLIMKKNDMTIEHILPKSKFISLVCYPFNLVPMCMKCNSNKGDKIDYLNIYHPYYETNHKIDCEDIEINIKFKKSSFEKSPIDVNYELRKHKDKNIIDIYNMHNISRTYNEYIFEKRVRNRIDPIIRDQLNLNGKESTKKIIKRMLTIEIYKIKEKYELNEMDMLYKMTLIKINEDFEEIFSFEYGD